MEEWLSIFDDPILGNSKPMPVVRAVQIRLTHWCPPACKLRVSRVVRTKADQGLVRIARATAWPGSPATALLVTPSRVIPVREIVNRSDFLRRCGYSPTQGVDDDPGYAQGIWKEKGQEVAAPGGNCRG